MDHSSPVLYPVVRESNGVTASVQIWASRWRVLTVWCNTCQHLTKMGKVDVFQSAKRLERYGERYTVRSRNVIP
eukprot:5077442-Ditylum_brightwellii.AAC.1